MMVQFFIARAFVNDTDDLTYMCAGVHAHVLPTCTCALCVRALCVRALCVCAAGLFNGTDDLCFIMSIASCCGSAYLGNALYLAPV